MTEVVAVFGFCDRGNTNSLLCSSSGHRTLRHKTLRHRTLRHTFKLRVDATAHIYIGVKGTLIRRYSTHRREYFTANYKAMKDRLDMHS